MNTGEERTRLLSTPQTMFGYTADQAPSELMAEAIRAYMADPNYLKTVAPKTSAAIRAAVNGNPKLAPIIQFNSMAPWLAGAGGAGAAWYLLPPDQRPGA